MTLLLVCSEFVKGYLTTRKVLSKNCLIFFPFKNVFLKQFFMFIKLFNIFFLFRLAKFAKNGQLLQHLHWKFINHGN